MRAKPVVARGMTCASLLMAAVASIAAEPAGRTCTTARFESLVNPPVRIESAAHVFATATVPAHCTVTGYIEHGSRIGFSAAFPDDWNQRFLFFGVGGFAGILEPLDRGIARGYATGTTDTGHRGASVEDASWALDNPAAVLNHYESGVELAARALQNLTMVYYGSSPRHSYFEGCSAGGRQGLIEAQRFPTTFDGIIAAAPAWNYSRLLITFVENGKEILRSPDNWLPPETFAEIDRVVMEQCDALDGVEDTIITDPRMCKPSLRSLLCKPGQMRSCLTSAQLRTLDRLIAPGFARNGSGYFGFRLTGGDRSGELAWGWPEWLFGTHRPLPDALGKLNFAANVLPRSADRGKGPIQFVLGEQFFRYMVMNDPRFDARTLDVGRDTQRLVSRLGGVLDADDTDLGRFVRSGGKLLLWHGWSDPAIPAEMAIDLYTRIVADTQVHRGQTGTDQAVRLFMVPGVQHCGGGFGLTVFDPLTALEQWVEQGRAPDRIVATQSTNGKPVRSRPVCSYPKTARYRGAGNPDDADSFDCK